MNNAKKALVSAKNFASNQKVPLTLITTAVTTAVIVKKVYGTAYKVAEEFIAEKGLTEEFINFIPKS